MRKIWIFFCLLLVLSNTARAASPAKLHDINHIIVISLENHSFDNLFGHFPGADGLDSSYAPQTDARGKVYTTLPPTPDKHFPQNLPNKPFPIETYVLASEKTHDLVHRFVQEQLQIDGGKMDRFAAVSDAGALTMGYYDGSKTTLWKVAQEYTLADHFFHAAFGGSFLNHFWMICACTPRFDNAPADLIIKRDKNGNLVKDGAVTADGYAVNTLYPAYTPHPAGAKKEQLLPPQTMPTIGDRLSEKDISWAWYSGGWDAAQTKPDPSFQFHHQPFAYFKNFIDGTQARKEHLKDEADFLAGLKKGVIPSVVFYKPLGEFSLHPGYADVAEGDAHIDMILQAIRTSAIWHDSVIIITFDENGGFWDHVAPPAVDRFGPGIRVPAIIMSPFAKKHYVDHTVYDTTSVLKLIETRFNLQPLGTRDAAANDLTGALDIK